MFNNNWFIFNKAWFGILVGILVVVFHLYRPSPPPAYSGDLFSIDHNVCCLYAYHHTDPKDDVIMSGTGFFVKETPKTYVIMTAGHLVHSSPEHQYQVLLVWGATKSAILNAKFLFESFDEQRSIDMGLLEVKKEDIAPYGKPSIIPLGDSNKCRSNDLGFTSGFPVLYTHKQHYIEPWPSILSTRITSKSKTWIVIVPGATGGRSGSPVYTPDLEHIIGMITNADENQTLAVPSNKLSEILK